MKRTIWLGLVVVLVGAVTAADAQALSCRFTLNRANRHLCGQLVDHTRNHGADRRIWSPALGHCRDLYVYLPPGYDPAQQYPLILWLHGFAQDENSFREDVVKHIDKAMACGQLPPAIVAAPDGSLHGSACLLTAGSFYLNSKAGAFEDYLMQDVWNFLMQHYPIRPEREAHVLAGVSMGGGAAYNLAIKYRDRFKAVLGIFPPLNTRWLDCHGRYFGDFDPCCWGWQTSVGHGFSAVGRFYGVVVIRLRQVIRPLYGKGPEAIFEISRENPIEMLDTFDVQPGQLDMYVAYGGRDQFNIDAQVESFLHRAHEKGIQVSVAYQPRGRHDLATAVRFLPGIIEWLNGVLSPLAAPTDRSRP